MFNLFSNSITENLSIPRSLLSPRRLAAIVCAVAMLATSAFAATQVASAQEAVTTQADPAFTLTIFHNNDGESKLLPDEGSGFPGVARFISTLTELKADASTDGVITLTSGDNFLASKEFNVSLARGVPYFDAIALSGQYDAMALGNHDFDLGPDVTAAFINSFDPAVTFVSANIDVSEEAVLTAAQSAGRLAKSHVVEYDGTRVGVIGAVTPQLPNISSPRNTVISAVAPAVNAEAARLQDAGVDIIILVSHLQSVNEELELVPELSGVDVVIAGGGDELLTNSDSTCLTDEEAFGTYPLSATNASGATVPVITGPGGYRCIGELTLSFDASGNIVSHSGRLVGVALDATPDATVQASVVDPLTTAVSVIQTTVIATSEVDLDGQRSSVRTKEANVGNLMADATLSNARALASSFSASLPHVGLQNGGGIRNDSIIPAGEITVADTFDMAPFSNFLVVVEVPRETFKVLLEQAVDGVPEARGQFAQLAGISITYDPAAAPREIDRDGDCSLVGNAGSRILEAVLDDGTVLVQRGEVVPGPDVVLATIDFLANGGDCYPLGDLDTTKLGISYQASLERYISETLGGQITAEAYPLEGTGRITALETDAVGPPAVGTGG